MAACPIAGLPHLRLPGSIASVLVAIGPASNTGPVVRWIHGAILGRDFYAAPRTPKACSRTLNSGRRLSGLAIL